jgi:N-acetylneuraminic acid mutarotase
VLVADTAGQKVYLQGGRSGGSVLDDLWVYDVAANSWAQLAPGGGPAARFGHNGAFDNVNQRLLIFGGQAGSTFYSDLWAYDMAANSWTQLAPNSAGPLDRYGAGGAFDPVSGSFYVSHGFTSNGRFDDTWRYGVGGGGWSDASASGVRPEPRCLLRTVVDPARGRLLLFGGQSNSTPYLGDLWAFNLANRSWQQLNVPGPSPRNFYAMTLGGDGDYLLLHGGNAGGSASSELWLFDLTQDLWTLLPAVGQAPPARNGHDMVWLAGQNTALLFGGDSAELWKVTFS